MPMFKRFEFCRVCGYVLNNLNYINFFLEARVCPVCRNALEGHTEPSEGKLEDGKLDPPFAIEVDERFLDDYIWYGTLQLGEMLYNEAKMDEALAQSEIYWEGGDENDALS